MQARSNNQFEKFPKNITIIERAERMKRKLIQEDDGFPFSESFLFFTIPTVIFMENGIFMGTIKKKKKTRKKERKVREKDEKVHLEETKQLFFT